MPLLDEPHRRRRERFFKVLRWAGTERNRLEQVSTANADSAARFMSLKKRAAHSKYKVLFACHVGEVYASRCTHALYVIGAWWLVVMLTT